MSGVQTIQEVGDQLRAGTISDPAGKVPKEFLNKIQPTFSANPPTAPNMVKQLGPVPFSKGGPTLTTDNKGGWTKAEQTIVQLAQQRDVAANVGEEFYAVTAGKTLYISSLTLSTSAAIATGFYWLSDTDIATPGLNVIVNNGLYLDEATTNRTLQLTFPVPFKVATSIFIEYNNGATIRFSFVGWEE